MGMGFTNNKAEASPHDVRYGIPVQPPHTKSGADVHTILKTIGGVIATLVLLGGLVWGASSLVASMATSDELEKVEDRVEAVEKNDIKQTIILEQIKESLEKIEKKLDEVLGGD